MSNVVCIFEARRLYAHILLERFPDTPAAGDVRYVLDREQQTAEECAAHGELYVGTEFDTQIKTIIETTVPDGTYDRIVLRAAEIVDAIDITIYSFTGEFPEANPGRIGEFHLSVEPTQYELERIVAAVRKDYGIDLVRK